MHQESKSILKKLFSKSVRNKTNASENKLLTALLLKLYYTASWDEKSMGDKNEIRDEIRSKISIKPVKKLNLTFLKYAAAIAIIISLAFIIQYKSTTSNILVITTENVLDSIALNDGSLVYLAPNSSLEYPEKFNGEQRNVKLLKGNAFFDIAKDPDHPFVIQSGEIKTKVLGTSFHIRLEEKSCRVAVVTGKVEVSYKNNTENLIPGEEVHTTGNTLKKEELKGIMNLNWYNQDIHLKEVQVKEVLDLIQLKYGITNTLKNTKINTLKLTLFIGKKASVEDILNQINYITNLNLHYENEIITTD
ncbi:FecR family protein [Cellulophaga sp. HaHaR_3_176]|uniref:FecR family protein n=1 Tax=Cellulophaga sp. HaHaR_3_176 TaxID=1942464 RepID=UPI001C1FF763|nr:FecR family protein [Cellulophaga sp. HaHaR_3_176]QWX83473.1 FecR family protein [Cellulophaga sp. HaHaR_3_176]